MGISKSRLGQNIARKSIVRKNNKKIYDLNNLEIERLQYSHDVHRTLFQGNFSSPVTETLKMGAKVLDFRCGPGTWSCEMSSDFGNSKFYAIESISCYPTQKPFNVEFIKSDMLNEKIPFDSDSFDFIFVRSAVLWYTISQWEEIILPELIRILKPGGYLEFMDIEMKIFGEGSEAPIMTQYAERFRGLLRSHNINPNMILEIPNLLSSSNRMIDIQADMRKCPIGSWYPKLGEWGTKLVPTLILQILMNTKLIEEQDCDDLIDKMMVEANKVQSYFCDHRIWAKKSNQETKLTN